MKILLIATRNLFGERGRFLITAGGVAFSVVLILVLFGLYQGWNTQMTKFLGSVPADFWVGQKGSRDVSHSISILPNNLSTDFENIRGVREVNTFIGRQVSFKKDGREIRIFLVGLDPNGIIKPYKIEQGKSFPEEDEIIIDKTIAGKERIRIGDKIDINGYEVKVSGISSGGNLLIYSYAFTNIENAKKMIDFEDFVNYYLISADNPNKTKKDLEDIFANLEIMTKQNFLDNNAEIIKSTFLPIIGILLLIAFAIGIAVIGLTIYTATIEKSQEYGVLRAIGYSNGQLFGIALLQSFMAGVVGLIVGNILVVIIVRLASLFVSGFIYEAGVLEISITILIVFLMSILASIIPLKRLLAIDPARVFKA